MKFSESLWKSWQNMENVLMKVCCLIQWLFSFKKTKHKKTILGRLGRHHQFFHKKLMIDRNSNWSRGYWGSMLIIFILLKLDQNLWKKDRISFCKLWTFYDKTRQYTTRKPINCYVRLWWFQYRLITRYYLFLSFTSTSNTRI